MVLFGMETIIDEYTWRMFWQEIMQAVPVVGSAILYGLLLLAVVLITVRIINHRWRIDPKKQTEVARNAIAWRDRKIARMEYLIERLESENAELRVNHRAALVMNSKVTELLGGMNGTGSQGAAYRETEKATGRTPAKAAPPSGGGNHTGRNQTQQPGKASIQQRPVKAKAG
jgi:hypothetical protein